MVKPREQVVGKECSKRVSHWFLLNLLVEMRCGQMEDNCVSSNKPVRILF